MPGSNVSSTIRTFSDPVQRRRRWTDVMISTRSAGLVIDTVVCLPLAKWETMSGRFGAISPRLQPRAAQSQAGLRDYVRVSPCPDAQTVMHQLSAWINHYNEVHPHKALGYRSPREFIAAHGSS